MAKLEDKILKKVYLFETKRTGSNIFFKILSFIVLAFLIFIFGIVIYEELVREKTFNLFQIFRENFEVVRRYFFDSLLTFYQELPKLISIIFVIFLVLLLFLIYFVVKNFGVIKNKSSSIVKFWLRDGKKK